MAASSYSCSLFGSVATRCVLVAGAFRGLPRLPQAGITRYERRLTG